MAPGVNGKRQTEGMTLMTENERLERFAVKTFKQHWSGIVRKLEKDPSFALKQYYYFEADTEARQLNLAERFYGLPHATKMASLDDKSILSKISCYLPRAIEYAIDENEDDVKAQKEFIRDLITHEYVIFDSSQNQVMEEYDEYWDGLWIASYPARVPNDDWYERSVGSSYFVAGTFLLMKSTGENFSKREMEWLRRSIIRNIDKEDIDRTLWWFESDLLEKNKAWIMIYELEPNEYVEDLLDIVGSMLSAQQTDLADKILSYLSENPDNRRFLKIFKKRQPKKDDSLYDIIASFLQATTDGAIIRDIEDIACRIVGLKDRDYHRVFYSA